MKKIFLLMVAALIFSTGYCEWIRQVGETFRFVYHIVDASGDHVTGETVTLTIERTSDGFAYDFNDSTFKTSGWSNKTTNLTEDSTDGYYYHDWTPPASETTANDYVFIYDNASGTYGDHGSITVTYQFLDKLIRATG